MTTVARSFTEEELLAQASWVQALARRLVADSNAADDVGQQAMVEALEKPPRHRGSLRAWFARVVRRRVLDRLRGERRRAHRETAAGTADRRAETPDEVLIRAETRARIAREVLTLEEPYRTAILLRYFEQMPTQAVADLLRVPEATVRTRLGRGVARLRERLENALGSDPDTRHRALLLVAGVAKPLSESWKGAAAVKGGVIMVTSAKKVAAAAAAVLLVAGGFAAYHLTHERSSEPPDDAAREENERGAPERESVPGLESASGARKGGRGAAPPSESSPAEGAVSPIREGEAVAEGIVAGVVRDASGAALRDVDVLLWDDVGRSIVARWKTGDDGTFRFDAVTGAERPISFHAKGMARVSGRVAVGKRSLVVTMTPGESADEGKTIRGVVVDERTGRVLERVPVAAVASPSARTPYSGLVLTEKDGTFVLRGLAAGSWTLRVGIFTGLAEGPAAEFLPKTAGPFELGTEDVRVELARGLAIEGEIQGPDGRPWTTGARVTAHPVADSGAVDYDRIRTVNATDVGAFRIPGLVEGRYDLTVEAKGGAGGTPGGLVHVGLVGAGQGSLVVRVTRGVALSGRLLDEDDKPVLGKGWVWVFEVGRQPGQPGTVAATLSGDGRFETPPLDPARAYGIRASGFPGYGVGELASVHPGDADVVVRVPAGGRIKGRVVDAEGKPAGFLVPVTASIENYDPMHPEPGTLAYVTTDAKGDFVLSGLRAGKFYVAAGGGTSGFVSTGPILVTVPATEPLTLRVERGVPFSGRLIDARGVALAFVDIQARSVAGRGGDAPRARTDADGRFSFAGVEKGRIALAATIGGTWTQLGEFDAPGIDAKVTAP